MVKSIKRQELIHYLEDKAFKIQKILKPLIQSGYDYKEIQLNLITTLIFDELRLKNDEPFWPNRDRLLIYDYQLLPLSAAASSVFGYFNEEDYYTNIEKWDTLILNLDNKENLNKTFAFFDIPGIDMVSNDITKLFNYAIGLSASSNVSRFDYNVYLLGSKENLFDQRLLHINTTFNMYNISNFIFIVDIEGIEDNSFLHKWFKAGWYILEKKGYDFNNILDLFKGVLTSKGQPVLLLIS